MAKIISKSELPDGWRNHFALSEDDFDVAFDLGTHAYRQAMETMLRVTDSAGRGRIQLAAAAIAHAFAEWHLNAIDGEMDKVDPGFAKLVAECRETVAKANETSFAEYSKGSRAAVFGADSKEARA